MYVCNYIKHLDVIFIANNKFREQIYWYIIKLLAIDVYVILIIKLFKLILRHIFFFISYYIYILFWKNIQYWP